MLVLSRKHDQAVMIGDSIRVVVVAIKGEVVQLGFEAPKVVPIHREEVYEEIKREGKRETK